MQEALDITWWQMLLFSTTLFIPYALNHFYQLELGKEMSVSVIRMVSQLLLVGLYLEFVFTLNSLLLNLVWVSVMVLIGASAILDKSKLPKSVLLWPVVLGLIAGLFPLIVILCLAIIRPAPFYSAQYVIPLCGMLLGNSLAGNIVALQNLFSAFNERKSEYEGALSLGASPLYASAPFVKAAMQKALAPILASMSTTGLVTLPGMMTGQILGGASPIIAIKYQLLILIAIFVMLTVSVTISLQLCLRRSITKEGRITIHPFGSSS
ncbi:ABC transporter permease [Vibrio tapetis subsp. quintayensis]|uniref:ABC transporter permease n=1 Tax=Vibrio tapetis TaxID=52443 RepID=UPI0025B52EB1|nr:ABC transporter permease [Vibrio tapetis]MDN3679839.1 ABC transporter permease [Vibrio tapetis subsp. quintayensis]